MRNIPEIPLTPPKGQTIAFSRQRAQTVKNVIPFGREEIEGSIPERFERIVRRFPNRCAINCDGQIWTYDSLNRVSNQLAHAILRQQGTAAEPIAILLDHGAAPIVAILGILKAGKSYVALDTYSPLPRLKNTLTDSQSTLLVTNRKHRVLASRLVQDKSQMLDIDNLENSLSDQNIGLLPSPDALAALFYTSGSTGQSKGVTWNSRSLLHVAWRTTNDYHIHADDHYSFLFSCSFSASPAGIFSTLLTGAALYPYNSKENGVYRLIRWLQEDDITIFHPPIPLFRQVLEALKEERSLTNLRLVILGGQTLYWRDVKQARKYLPEHCKLVHQFGLTETGGLTQFFIEQPPQNNKGPVPIGYVSSDKEILLLDENRQKVETDEVGEISVRSRYLSSGYWNDPELTRQKFLPDPEGGNNRFYLTGDLGRMRPDGCLEYLNRKDFMVKIRGYRVVLTEIESALYHLDVVKEAVVVARARKPGDAVLVAYVVPAYKPTPTVSDLRRELAKVLPEYMLPARFVLLESLPQTSTGKVDRRALPEPDWKRPVLEIAFVAPRNELEWQLVRLCEDLLGVRPIGVEDNLFDLGMHSIQALRLLVNIEKTFERTILPKTLLKAATISQLAGIIESQEDSGDSKYEASHTLDHAYSSEPQSLEHSSEPSRNSRLEALFHLHIGGVRLPYSVGIKLLSWLCGSRWGQKQYFYPHTIANMRKFLASIGLSDSAASIIRQHLMITHHFRAWQLESLARCTSDQFTRRVQGSGDEIIRKVRQDQQSIILADSHFGLKGIVNSYLDRVGFSSVARLVGRHQPSQNRKRETGQDSEQTLLSLDESNSLFSLYTARQYLEEEQGMVYITPDGGTGFANISVLFLGRLFPFGTGFAELAIMTEAVVIPVFTSLKSSGQITIEFLEPLETGSSDMSHQDRIASFITQYAALLEQRWRTDPGNINPGPLRRFLKLPLVTETSVTNLLT